MRDRMTSRILVGYATKYGSTSGVAEAIAEELVAAGLEARAVPLAELTTLEGADGVVLGAPIYVGRPLGLASFVNTRADALARLPVAAFATALAPVSPKAGELDAIRQALVDTLSPLAPVSTAVFAGALDPAQMGLLDRAAVRLLGAPTGDHRDWTAIRAWARALVPLLGAGTYR